MIMVCFTSQICLILLVLLCAVRLNTISSCHESDMSLLLMFKKGVIDPSNRLSSWSTRHDCCLWHGVFCDNTRRVIQLDLMSRYNNHSEPLRGEINLSSLFSLPYLEILQLDTNDFESIGRPSINDTTLPPKSFSKLSSLGLSYNDNLRIDNLHYWFSLLPSLTYLDLSGIPLPSESSWLQPLAFLPLENLYLRECNLTTSSLSFQYANFKSLVTLDLGQNDLRLGLPNWLFNLSKDHLLDIYLDRCNLRGHIPDFSGYASMWLLELSNNKIIGPIPDWLGNLRGLHSLYLVNNFLQGSMPSNLANSSFLSEVDISFNQLSEAHPKILEHHYDILDLSHNSISGDISNFLLASQYVDLSFNKFEGQLPRTNSVMSLNLAHNSFSGSLSSLLCPNGTKYDSLVYLDISNNFLTEELPDCWSKWPDMSCIYLGSNKLSGKINPTMASSLPKLLSLDLSDNSFHGHIPRTFKNFTSLVLLNLEGNNFSGVIPTWMPQSVYIVKLRSNHFSGVIPTQLFNLSNLILLDLANNSLSGSIPHYLHNLTLMVVEQDIVFFSYADRLSATIELIKPYLYRSELHTKGQDLEYEKNLKLVRCIDLSANELSGEIPVQLFSLHKLHSLNLSYNYLRGEIPKQIGEMKDLESLDLSHNNLHGNIPESMSSLSFLGVLNLSSNHLSGQIPLGTQLQSFSSWSYVGNPQLCGAPLPNNCTGPPPPNNTKHIEGNENDGFLKALYLGMGVGYAVGFWVVCGSLFLNRTCRHTFFRFFDGVVNRIYVIVAIKLRRFR